MIFATHGALTACVPTEAPPVPADARLCIDMGEVRNTRIRSNARIDFQMRDRRWLTNRLPESCRNLLYEGDFTYARPRRQICPGDEIVVTSRAWSMGEADGAICALGTFMPRAVER